MSIYIFIRKDGFYPVEYPDDERAIEGAVYNNGTIRVEDIDGRLVWDITDTVI